MSWHSHRGTTAAPTFAANEDKTTGINFPATAGQTDIIGSGVVLASFSPTGNIAGTGAGAAASVNTFRKTVTGVVDATLTTVLTITVPNTAQTCFLKVKGVASLGASGTIGAFEANKTFEYDGVISRTAGVNAVGTFTILTGSANEAHVAGAATLSTATLTLSSVTGAVGATNTFTLQVTITKSTGASDLHQVVLNVELLNANASGITIA